MPASPEGVGRLHAWLDGVVAASGHDMSAAWPIYVAIDEVITNSARHGYRTRPGEVDAALRVEGDTVSVTLADDAPPFDPRLLDPGGTMGQPTGKPGGHGVALVLGLMDRVDYEYRGGRNVLTLVLTIARRTNEAP